MSESKEWISVIRPSPNLAPCRSLCHASFGGGRGRLAAVAGRVRGGSGHLEPETESRAVLNLCADVRKFRVKEAA